MLKCPQCHQAQSIILSPVRLGFRIDFRPRVWRCRHCNRSLSFTPKGILLFWGICFPTALGVAYVLLWDLVEKYPPLIAAALMAVLVLTFLFSIILKKHIYPINTVNRPDVIT